MASVFECEIRFPIANYVTFEQKLKGLGAVADPYEFVDYYFRPNKDEWNTFEKNLRIREWRSGTKLVTVYFAKLEIVEINDLKFKRALYPHGKVPLFSGEFTFCKKLLEDLGFKQWLIVHKERANLWDFPEHGFKIASEYIEDLGWTGEVEVEGDDPQRARKEIDRIVEILGIPKDKIDHRPISIIVAEKRSITQD